MRTRRRTRRGGSASSSDSDEAAAASPRRPLRKRKPSAEAIAAAASPTRQVRSKPPPEVAAAARDDDNSDDDVDGDSSDDGEASSDWDVAEVAVGVRAFPDLPPRHAAALWARFVDNAKACIEHYNTKHQADFVLHKRAHALGCGLLLLGEQDGSCYYHVNFHAQDKRKQEQRRSHSQLFFGEIRVRVQPKEEDVTCCCPVSAPDAGGKRLETVAEAMKYKFPAWGTAGVDRERCYGCYSAMKHPEGKSYVAGHVADPRQYFVPDK